MNKCLLQRGSTLPAASPNFNGVMFQLIDSGDVHLGIAGSWVRVLTGGLVGSIISFAGDVTPSGYLDCFGDAVSRSIYFDLFAAIGTTWGIGDGVTTFNLPDLQRYAMIGSGGVQISGPGVDVGDTDGAETHILTVDEIPPHSHGYTGTSTSTDPPGAWDSGNNGDPQRSRITDLSGGGQSHNNMQPSAVVKMIIKY